MHNVISKKGKTENILKSYLFHPRGQTSPQVYEPRAMVRQETGGTIALNLRRPEEQGL